MRKTTFVLCAILSGLALTTDAGGAVAVKSPLQSIDEAIRQDLGVSAYTLQDLDLPAGREALFFTNVTIDGSDLTLELHAHSVRGDGFMLLVQDDSGTLNRVEPPPPRTLRGSLLELPDSEVAGSLLESGLSALIWMPDGTVWTIQPLKQLVADARRATHVVYRDSSPGPWECGLDTSAVPHSPDLGEADADQGGTDGTGVTLTDLAIDADLRLYRLNGSSVEATVADVENVLNGNNIVYRRDVEILFEITTIVVRTSEAEDPYDDITNNGALLNRFISHWNNNHDDIQRDVAHLMTGINIDGNIIGTANGIGNICFNSYSFAQTRFTSSLRFRVALTAHEIGHNYNALHCNSNPPCNIMCSGLGGCNGVGSPNFGPWVIPQIISHRNSRNCVQSLRPPRELPFRENFGGTNRNRNKWSYEKGTSINDSALNEPSGEFSIELDTGSPGDEYDDELRSNFMLLSGASDVIVQYWTEHRGVEAGEELIVEYRTNAWSWREINRITSDGIDQDEFVLHQHRLGRNNAYHDEFRLRFRTEVDQRNDNFYIDSIRVAADPFFRVEIDSVGVTELPVQVRPAALGGNSDGITPFGRNYVIETPLSLTAPAEHQGEQFFEWRMDGQRATTDLTLITTVTAAFTAEAVYGATCNACDMDCSGDVDAFDIEPFLDLLFKGTDPCCGERGQSGSTGDTDGDGDIDAFDIEPFLDCLFP